MNKKSLNGFYLSSGTYREFIDELVTMASGRKSSYTCVANVHMFIEAYQNPAFSKIIGDADMVAPDGIPLCWYLRLKYGLKQERVAGMDLLPDLLGEMARKNLSVAFYGGTPEMLQQTNVYINQHYPALQISAMLSPPFRALTVMEEEEVIQQINDSRAHLVFVILGCPRQEKWMAAMKGRIHATMIGVGGALPVLIGQQKRAPRWMQKGGLEWLFRLAQEPGRLFKRYAITNSYFIYLLCKDCISSLFLKKAY